MISLVKYRKNLQRLNQQRRRVIVLAAVDVADPAGVRWPQHDNQDTSLLSAGKCNGPPSKQHKTEKKPNIEHSKTMVFYLKVLLPQNSRTKQTGHFSLAEISIVITRTVTR